MERPGRRGAWTGSCPACPRRSRPAARRRVAEAELPAGVFSPAEQRPRLEQHAGVRRPGGHHRGVVARGRRRRSPGRPAARGSTDSDVAQRGGVAEPELALVVDPPAAEVLVLRPHAGVVGARAHLQRQRPSKVRLPSFGAGIHREVLDGPEPQAAVAVVSPDLDAVVVALVREGAGDAGDDRVERPVEKVQRGDRGGELVVPDLGGVAEPELAEIVASPAADEAAPRLPRMAQVCSPPTATAVAVSPRLTSATAALGISSSPIVLVLPSPSWP